VLGTAPTITLGNGTGLPLTTGVTGILPVANGGTGSNNANGGFNALSPMTTAGDIIYGGLSGAGTRLGIGSNGYVLTVSSGAPVWAAASGGGSAATPTALGTVYGSSSAGAAVSLGYQAAATLPSASTITAIGYQALQANTTSTGNDVALGYQALYQKTSGYGNAGLGFQALAACTTGKFNCGIGYLALQNLTTGTGNIGIQPAGTTEVYNPVFNVTTENNRIAMGSASVTNAYVQVAWTVVSDARDKTNFAPIGHGLSFVNQLNPISFQFKENRETDVPHGPVRYGFKAQEILALEGDNPVIIDNEDSEKLRYNGEALVPVLVKAIQELSARVAALEAK